MIYRKLKRTWSHGYAGYIPRFKETFPELSKIDNEELCDRLIKLKMDFYYEKETPVPFLLRLTMPFAFVVMIGMIVAIPFVFIITGEWGYSLGENNRILNWFRAVKIQ